MEIIDQSFEKFKKIKSEISSYSNTINTEQDVRVKIIDRILVEILNWPYEEISTEPSTVDGYIDYRLSVNGIPKLILEAKKDFQSFEIEKEYSGKSLKLNGAILKTQPILDGVKQAIYYCSYSSVELACLSNGHQWIIFRGNRLGDGREVLSGSAFVFTSLDSIEENFKLFYNLLSFDNVALSKYRAYFQEEEGEILRSPNFNKAIYPIESRQVLSRTSHANDFDKIMNLYFKKLDGEDDPQMLIDCFIHTRESELADKKIGRIAEDLITSVKKISTDGPGYLAEIIQRVKSTERNEFVVIVGTKGAGKTTYTDRFFSVVLPQDLRNNCIVIKINLGESDGDEKKIIDWLNVQLLEIAEKEVFNGNPSYDELQGMFFNEYERWRDGTYKHLYDKDKDQFKIEFGKHIEKRREERPLEYIKRIIGDIVKSRHKVPCIIFDNADHHSIEFQEKVFQYARSIYEEQICLIIMPITDKTSWQLSNQGALQSFESETLYLPTPSPKSVIQERIQYLDKKVKEDKSFGASYLVGKGIKLSIKDLTGFVSSLQGVLLNNSQVSSWIGNLSNLDIRRCLELTRELIASPHLNLEQHVTAYVSKSSVSIKSYLVCQAIIKGKYNIYPHRNHKFVQNIFCMTDEFVTSPLLCLRILQLLVDKKSNNELGNEYVTVNQIIDYFRGIGIDNNITITYLDLMLKTGLCYSYDPTQIDIKFVNKLQISPSGRQHRNWGVADQKYLQCMLDTTPLMDDSTYASLNNYKYPESAGDWNDRLAIFLEYLLIQDKLFCQIPEHDAYKGQLLVNTNLEKLAKFVRERTTV